MCWARRKLEEAQVTVQLKGIAGETKDKKIGEYNVWMNKKESFVY
jgi:hypothetical protein